MTVVHVLFPVGRTFSTTVSSAKILKVYVSEKRGMNCPVQWADQLPLPIALKAGEVEPPGGSAFVAKSSRTSFRLKLAGAVNVVLLK